MAERIQRPPPAVDVIESEELVQYLSPALLTIDYTSTTVKLTTIVTTFSFFSFLFFVFFTGCRIFFHELEMVQKVFMSRLVTRGVYGHYCIIVGLYALLRTTNLDRDVVFGRNVTCSLAMYIFVGYLLFDLVVLLVNGLCFGTFDKAFILHHTLSLASYGMAIYYEAGFSIHCKVLIEEMASPYAALNHVLKKSGKGDTVLWKVNQAVQTCALHARSLVEFYVWYIIYSNWPYIRAFMPKPVLVPLLTGYGIVTFVLTPYWAYQKTMRIFRTVEKNIQEAKGTSDVSNGHTKKAN